VKILICFENDLARGRLRSELEAAGHQVTDAAEPLAMASAVFGAGALLVDLARAKLAIALLRDRGFAGRAVLAFEDLPGDAHQLAQRLGADGILALSPPEELVRRFALAVGGKRRVLVVDDSEASGMALAAELETAGFEALYAPDMTVATACLLRRARPDLLLLDVDMPRVSGAQLCRFIKMNDRFRSIRVVLCGAGGREELGALAAQCGADGFVLKEEFLGKSVG
jgi:CheY-like chemotaxis protein